MYEKECSSTVETFLQEHGFNKEGLTKQQVAENRAKYGLNILKQKKPKEWYNYLLESLLSPFNLILLGITLVLIYTDVILTNPPSYANIIVILILITVSTLIEFFEV